MREARAVPEEAFWRFSLYFYKLPNIAQALLALQDRDGLDINLILFALWFGISGRGRLDSDALTAAERAIGKIRSEIVEPLRSLRRKLKEHPDGDVQRLREGIKALELEGEKLVQTRLGRFAGSALGEISAEDCRAAAVANLTLYLGLEKAASAEAALLRGAIEQLVPRR
jgi:uncharacterized protein (TIGR02444 family)